MKRLLTALPALIVLASSAAFSAPFDCAVDLTKVLIYADGRVNVLHSARNDYTYICSLKEERQGVSTTTCAMWTSMLLSLKNANKKASFYYDTPMANGSCANLPTYDAAPAPIYIGAY